MTPSRNKLIASGLFILALPAALTASAQNAAMPIETLSAAEALQSANIATVDPGALDTTEIASMRGAGPVCTFSYTSDSAPVLAYATDGAIIKLNNKLVRLSGTAQGGSVELNDGPLRMQLAPVDAKWRDALAGDKQPMVMQLDVGEGLLRAGYRGYATCTG